MPLGLDPAASQIAFHSFEEASLVCLRPYGSATLTARSNLFVVCCYNRLVWVLGDAQTSKHRPSRSALRRFKADH